MKGGCLGEKLNGGRSHCWLLISKQDVYGRKTDKGVLSLLVCALSTKKAHVGFGRLSLGVGSIVIGKL